MPTGIRITIDGRGEVFTAGEGKWLGRIPEGRAPTPNPAPPGGPPEFLDVRDSALRTIGWVTTGAEPGSFELITASERPLATVAGLEELVSRYAATPNEDLLSEGAVQAANLLHLVPALDWEQQDRYLAAVSRLTALAEAEILKSTSETRDSVDSSAANDRQDGETTAPVVIVPVGKTILLSEASLGLLSGGVKVDPGNILKLGKELTKPELIRIGENWYVRIGNRVVQVGRGTIALLFNPFVLGPLAGVATLAWQYWVLRHIVTVALESIAEVLRRLLEQVESAWDEFRLSFIEKLLPAVPPEFADCVFDCYRKLTKEIGKAFTDAFTMIAQQLYFPRSQFNRTVLRAFKSFFNCLFNCGLPIDLVWEYYLWLVDEYLSGRVGFLLSRLGFLPPAFINQLRPTNVPPEARNAARRATQNRRIEGLHRRGGFAFEEFPEQDDPADISTEDPNTLVDGPDVELRPGLSLDKFGCSELAMRVAFLRRRLSELKQTVDGLRVEIEGDIARGDRSERTAIRRKIEAYRSAQLELRGVSAALVRALDEMQRKPCSELSPDDVRDLRSQARSGFEMVERGPRFLESDDWFHVSRPEEG